MGKLWDLISECIAMGITYIVIFLFTLSGILIRPAWFLFDRRRYIVPKTLYGEPLGVARFYCFIHYALKEDGSCPNCGRKKQDLIKR